MSSQILLNSTKAMYPGSGDPRMVPAGETITDALLQSALQGAGGVLWPAADVTVAAAAVIVQKLRAQGADEAFCSRAMLGAAAASLSQSDSNFVSFTKTADDGAAGTATAETPVGMVAPTAGGDVKSLYYVPNNALTANDTTYATITVNKRTNGGAPVVIGSVTTQTTAGGGSGNWTAWVPVQIPIVAGSTVAALDVLTYAITKASTGVVVRAGQLLGFAT